jgi:hypothetical protein
MMLDAFDFIDLLLQGQRGWIVIALSGLVTAILGKKLLRFRVPRPSTQAFIGGSGRMDAQTRNEVDALMNAFERFYTQLARIKSDLETRRDTLPNVAERVLMVSRHMHRECQRLDDLNIAFSRNQDHKQFLARIERERGKAVNLYKAASVAKRQIARRQAAAPRQRAG